MFLRSEEHLLRWSKPGVTLLLDKAWELAHAWYGDRLAPDYTPRTRDASQAILDGLGLVGAFWRLS